MPKSRNEVEGYNRDQGLDTYLVYDGSNRTQYVCMAYPGALTSASVWQIFKLSYDSTSTRVVKKRYANKSDDYKFIADNYASYNYVDI